MKNNSILFIFLFTAALFMACPPPETTGAAITSIKLSETEVILAVDETLQLTATIAPEEAKNSAVKWTSSDEGVATVSNTGLVTAKSAGTAAITVASAADAKIKASVSVTVVAALPFSVSTPLTMNQGEPQTISVTEIPEGTTLQWELTPADGVVKMETTDAGVILTASAPGDAELKATAVDSAGTVLASGTLPLSVAGVPETVARGGTLYTLVKAYDFTEGEEGLVFEPGDPSKTPTITTSVENGLLKVTYPQTKSEGVFNATVNLTENADFVEIKAKLADGTTVASRAFVGLGKGGNTAPAWKTGFIFTDGVGQGNLGSGWGFRSYGTSKPNLTYSSNDLTVFHTFGINTEGTESFFFDGGNKKTGNDIISTGNSYQFNLGQDSNPTAAGTVYIDYVAFYKAGGYVPDPDSTQRIFLESPVTGTVVNADGERVENAEYDLMVGNKVFKSIYIDDFSGYNNDITNFWAKKMTIPAELGGDGTEVDAWRKSPGNFNVESGEDTVKIKDNQLILSVLKIDTTEGSGDYNKYIAPYADYNGNRKAQIDARRQVIVGGLFWNHKWLYGYMEATIKMVYKYKSVWCGFYTYGLKESRFGHEIDIYEPHLTTAADQIIHYPKEGGNGRVASWINSPAIDTSQFVRTAVAWSPDKLTFYLNENETGSIKEGEYGKLTDRDQGDPPQVDMPAAGLNIIPDTPQDVHLDIASNGDLSGYAGESGFADPQINWTESDGQSYDFIYFKSFKVYNYVGELVSGE